MSRELFVMKILKFFSLAFCAFLLHTSIGSSITLAEEKKFNLVVFGDSLVAGYRLGPGESFPERLQVALKETNPNVTVINAGVSGDTTTAGLARLDWSIAEGTHAVLLELGANDALRGIPANLTMDNLERIITRLKERNIKVLLAGMLAPPNMGPDYASEFNPIYSKLAEKYDLTLYPFFLEGVAGEPSLNQADGMHPTLQGVDVMVSNILPTVKTFLEKLD